MRSLFLVGIATAACGGNPTKNREVVGNRAPPPPKPACTAARIDAIAKALQRTWNTSEAPIVRCTPGLFPTPGFYLEVDDDTGGRHTGVLAANDNTEVVPFTREGMRPVATTIAECATVDLDGDGSDEIVETWRRSSHGAMGTSHWLEIRRIVEHRFTTIVGPHTSVYHPDLGGCRAEVRLAGKTLVISVENLVGIPPSDCLREGTHTFALDGDELVEIDVARLTRR